MVSKYLYKPLPASPVLRAWLDKHFGSTFYVDDVDIVDRNDREGKTVAYVRGITDNGLFVEYADDRPETFLAF